MSLRRSLHLVHHLIVAWLLLVALTAFSALSSAASDPESTWASCPAGTTRRGDAPPHGSVLYCQDETGARHGPFVSWHANGNLHLRGEYVRDRREGWWRAWSETGELDSEREYRKGEVVARRRFGDEAQRLRPSRPGDPVHPCPEGSIVAGAAPPESHQQWCEKARPDGAWVRHGPWLQFRSTRLPVALAKRETYRAGVLDGASIEYRLGRERERIDYVRGRKHGFVIQWHPNGTKASQAEYRDGVETGRFTRWDREGRLELETSSDEDGLVRRRTFHPNGQVAREETSGPHRKLHGIVREWWPNGQLEREGRMEAGRMVGTWKAWTSDGRLQTVTTYRTDGSQEEEVFPVFVEAPEGALPRPDARGEARAPVDRLHCPDGSRTWIEEQKLGAGDYLMPRGNRGAPGTPADAVIGSMVRGFLNLTSVEVLRIEACVVGRATPKKHGPAVFWTKKGNQRVADAFFRDDEKHGQWRWWGHDGRLSEEVDYRENQRHGRLTRWDSQGRPHSVESYDRGRLHGPFATWWPNGSYRTTGFYRYGEHDGLWTEHEQTGFRRTESSYQNGKKHGRWVWREYGRDREAETTYRGGIRHGPFADAEWRGNFENGEKSGLWVRTRNGDKEEEGYFSAGVREGGWILYRNGIPSARGRYERGLRVGTWTEYHENGIKRAEGDYAWCADPPHVEVTPLPPDGRRMERHLGPQGCRVGSWTFWSDDGRLEGQIPLDERKAR